MKVAAVVLAAGESRRMGRPKMALPWGNTSVIGRVVEMLLQGGAAEVLVVTGGHRAQVEAALTQLPGGLVLRSIHNPGFDAGEMTRSLQVGLSVLGNEVDAALVALGDQPQIQAEVVARVIAASQAVNGKLVAPSYQMHRGHPWLVGRQFWQELLALRSDETLRDFLNRHSADIHYVNVDTNSILKDMDTPQDYEQERPS